VGKKQISQGKNAKRTRPGNTDIRTWNNGQERIKKKTKGEGKKRKMNV